MRGPALIKLGFQPTNTGLNEFMASRACPRIEHVTEFGAGAATAQAGANVPRSSSGCAGHPTDYRDVSDEDYEAIMVSALLLPTAAGRGVLP